MYKEVSIRNRHLTTRASIRLQMVVHYLLQVKKSLTHLKPMETEIVSVQLPDSLEGGTYVLVLVKKIVLLK